METSETTLKQTPSDQAPPKRSGPCLVLKTDAGSRQFPLTDNNCWTVGRSDDNNFVLGDCWISRNHAMLQSTDAGEFYLIDLGSRNGSFLNGRRVSIPMTLHNDDTITLGQTELTFACPETIAAAPKSYCAPPNISTTAMLPVRRLISVLVIDIRDYTAMTRRLDERVLFETAGLWSRYAEAITHQYDGWVDKSIGGAVMAVWIHGTEDVTPHSMLQISQAMSALNKMTARLHEELPLPFPLRIGAGLNTGYAMVGKASGRDYPNCTPLGDTIIAASRLENSTRQLGLDISVGEKTYQALEPLGVGDRQMFKRYQIALKDNPRKLVTYGCAFSDLDRFLEAYSREHQSTVSSASSASS